MGDLMLGLTAYVIFYNAERTHQSLDYSTPNDVYELGIGGGAMIVDKFGGERLRNPLFRYAPPRIPQSQKRKQK